MKKLLVFGLLGTLALAGSLMSQTTVYGNGSGFLSRFDTNRDGIVSAEEYAAARSALLSANSRYDLNGDGTISADERAAMWADRMKNNPQAISRHDTNGDGVLDETEIQNAISNSPGRGSKSRFGTNSNLTQYDTDGNGVLSDAERTAMRMDRMKNNPMAISQHDTDGDGILSDAEMQHAISQNPAGSGRRGTRSTSSWGWGSSANSNGIHQRLRDGSGTGMGRGSGRGRRW